MTLTFGVTWSDNLTCRISPAIYEIMGRKHIGVTTFIFLGHMTSIRHAISYWYSIGNEALSSTIFEILASRYIWVTILTFQGHVTSLVTWPRCHVFSIVTESVYPTFSEIMDRKHIGVTSLTFLSHIWCLLERHRGSNRTNWPIWMTNPIPEMDLSYKFYTLFMVE